MNNVVAVVVTYNRKELLKENIKALIRQTYKNLDIFIIDNASTDGTEEVVKNFLNEGNVFYFNTKKNLGGAGGFNFGFKEAMKKKYEYCWIMDDDTIPVDNSLESLIRKSELLNNKFSFLCSLVKFKDGNLCAMNKPKIDEDCLEEYIKIQENNLISVNSASFVSCLVNMQYARKVGIPIKEFFIYGDDVEYTLRLSKLEKAYIDIDSVVVHKMKKNTNTNIVTVEKERIDRAFYTYRNRNFISRKNGAKEHIIYLLKAMYTIIKIIFKSKDYKLKRIWTVLRGMIAGIFFNPKIEVPKEND